MERVTEEAIMQTIDVPPTVEVPRGLNAAVEYIDRPVTDGRGQLTAVRFVQSGDGSAGVGDTLTYAQLRALVDRGAGALAANHLEMEQRVALLMNDSPAWLAAFFGAMKLGAVPVPLNTILPVADYIYLLNDSRARLLVADAGLWAGLREHRRELRFLRAVLVTGESA